MYPALNPWKNNWIHINLGNAFYKQNTTQNRKYQCNLELMSFHFPLQYSSLNAYFFKGVFLINLLELN